MTINLDPKIVRKSGEAPCPKAKSYSTLDRPQNRIQKSSNFEKAESRDPAELAFTTDSAFRSRNAR